MTPARLSLDPKLDLFLERTVDLSPELIWEAWTNPKHVTHWFTPAPWKTTSCRIDLRPGGRFETTMLSPEGKEHPHTGTYLELVPLRKLVWTDALLPGFRPAEAPFCTCELHLERQGEGTKYTAIARHKDEASRQKHETMGFEQGWGKALDQLVAHMKSVGDAPRSSSHPVVSREDWMAASAEFLQREKAFTRMRDELARARRDLPWTLIEKDYVFTSPTGKKRLADLFDGRRQLFVQHFMFGPGWKEGCPGCSFEADHIDGTLAHLAQRDVSFVAISRAPLADLEAFKKRMGWKFAWVSSAESDFNFDFNVSFTEKQKASGEIVYNFAKMPYETDELPGNSVFLKGEDGRIYRTYSSYARGCETLITTYMLLDLLPKGRGEDGFRNHPMEWLRHHDRYEAAPAKSCH